MKRERSLPKPAASNPRQPRVRELQPHELEVARGGASNSGVDDWQTLAS